MGIIKNEFLLKNLVEKEEFLDKSFIKLNSLSFSSKNSSFVLGKKNGIFFNKTDKLALFWNEILLFYLNFFKQNGKNLFFSDEKLIFLFGKEACMRSFQSIFFGVYNGGIFTNNPKSTKDSQNILSKVDMFLFLSIKDYIFSCKELNSLNKPFVIFLKRNTKLENYLFYKIIFQENLFFFQYCLLRMLSDLLIKIRIYNYIELQTTVH